MQTAPAPPPRVNSASSPAGRSLRAPLILALAAIGCTALLLQPLGGAGLFPAAPAALPNAVTPSVTWGVSARAAVSETAHGSAPVLRTPAATTPAGTPVLEPAAAAPSTAPATEPSKQLATGLRSKRQLAALAKPSPVIPPDPAQSAQPASAGTEPAADPVPAPVIATTAQPDPPAIRDPLPLQVSVVPLDPAAMRALTHPAAPSPASSRSGVRSGSSPNG